MKTRIQKSKRVGNPANNPQLKRTEQQIIEDRLAIALWRRQGLHYFQIAALIGETRPYTLSKKQVWDDHQKNLREALQERVTATSTNIDEELAKLGYIEAEAWGCFERSKEPCTTRTVRERVSADGSFIEEQTRIEDRHGDPRFLELVLKCHDRRCRLLGLTVGQKGEVVASDRLTLQFQTPIVNIILSEVSYAQSTGKLPEVSQAIVALENPQPGSIANSLDLNPVA